MKLYSFLAGLVLATTSAFAGQMTNLIETGAFQFDTLPFLRTGVQTHQFCSYDRSGDNFDWEYFPLYTDTNGECVIFDAMGPGCLYRQHMNIWGGATNYNGIQIRFYFDNESKPRIDMDVSTFFSTNNPLGYFFGIYRSNLVASYNSLPLSWSNNQASCYFPMPFWKSAVIQIENRGKAKVTVIAIIDYKTSVTQYPQDRCGYLFANYHREDPRVEGVDYTYLEESNCSGQVVGHVTDRWNTSMEENERTYFDGSETPAIEGDGYEDDQGMGYTVRIYRNEQPPSDGDNNPDHLADLENIIIAQGIISAIDLCHYQVRLLIPNDALPHFRSIVLVSTSSAE